MNGLSKEEYINLLQQCGMCTKKWTKFKVKKFEELRKSFLIKKYKVKEVKR